MRGDGHTRLQRPDGFPCGAACALGKGKVWFDFSNLFSDQCAVAETMLGLQERCVPAMPTGTKPGVLVEQGMCKNQGC